MRILIAEDDLTSRVVLKGVLERHGHEVLETSDGLQAIEELQRPGGPSMAILDWMMPGMEGVEIVRRIRASGGDNPIYLILLTARGSKADITEGLDAGADDYITKPFDSSELRARIRAGERILEMQGRLREKVAELEQALAEVKTLRGIIPICSICKKIRDDKGYWRQVELYISEHTEALFSHGVCPECMRRLYPEYADEE
jgi:DNA-binding response OmpR family regulator